MEADLRRDLLPPFSSDPEPLLRPCVTDFTSSTSSAITLHTTSEHSSHHSSPAADAPPFPDQLTRWTDQQHSLYLKSLEASFVNELHRSMRLRGWSLQNNTDGSCKPRTLQNSHNMPREPLALHDGCQKKISLERISPLLESTADSRVLAGSQFVCTSVERGFRLREPNNNDRGLLCDVGAHAGRTSTFSNRAQRSLEKQCIGCSSRPESVASPAEVTDENFKEEVAESSSMRVVKRLKTAAADVASSNDQIVPLRKCQ